MLAFLTLTSGVYAVTTPTEEPEAAQPTAIPTSNSPINQLKDRIASRVAELKLVERRGIIGTATEVTQTQITITDLAGNTRYVDVDELTKFASPSAKDSFGISDITKGTKLGVLGLFNKQSRRILSRFVDVAILPTTLHGVVTSVDTDNFVVMVTGLDGKTTPVDIENLTKTTSYDKTGTATKSGFSKIKTNERVIIVGYQDKQDPKRLIASRILLFPELPKDPRIQTAAAPTAEEAPVSTGSGKKLTPLTR